MTEKPPIDPPELDLRETFELLVHLTYGRRGQTAMAKTMSEITGRNVGLTLLNNWMTGYKPIPGWAAEALPEIYWRAHNELTLRTQRLEQEVWQDLKRHLKVILPLGPHLDPEPEEDDRPAPSM